MGKLPKLKGKTNIGDVAKKTSALWKAASEKDKAPFDAEAKALKDKYASLVKTEGGKKALKLKAATLKKAKAAKKKKLLKAAAKKVAKDGKLKKPLSAFFMWLQDNRAKLKKEVGSNVAK